MPPLELNQLAQDVEAIFIGHGIDPDTTRVRVQDRNVCPYLWVTYSAGHNAEEWELMVHDAYSVHHQGRDLPQPAAVTYNGEVTAVGLAVMRCVYARVNGQGGRKHMPDWKRIEEVERLAALALDAFNAWTPADQPLSPWGKATEAVREAVCPPGCIVVPRAILSAHLDAVEEVVAENDWEGRTRGGLDEAVSLLRRTGETIREALGGSKG